MNADQAILMETLAEQGHTWSQSQAILRKLDTIDRLMMHETVFEEIGTGRLVLPPAEESFGEDDLVGEPAVSEV